MKHERIHVYTDFFNFVWEYDLIVVPCISVKYCVIFSSWNTKPRLTKQDNESFVKLRFFSSYYYYWCHKNIKWNNKNKSFKTLDNYLTVNMVQNRRKPECSKVEFLCSTQRKLSAQNAQSK